MASLQALRQFINERLTAAAAEIFTVFEQTIVQYEEEIDRHRRLMEINWTPQVKLQRIEFPQHHDSREYEQTEPGPSQIKLEQEEELELLQYEDVREKPEPSQKEEHEYLGSSQEGELLAQFKVPSIEGQSYHHEPDEEPDTDQFLSHDVKNYLTSESTMDARLKEASIIHGDCVDNVPFPETQTECQKILCSKRFSHPKKLLVHMRTHTGDKLYSCKICGESFIHHCSLQCHMKMHTGEKLFSCETCGKMFNHHSSLAVHIRTHTGEKPFSCELCGKRFSQQSTLVTHMRTHTGEKPYPCEVCGKGFAQRSHLVTHMRIHTGEKPFSCETCGKSFTQHSHLLVHMRIHTGEACWTGALQFSV